MSTQKLIAGLVIRLLLIAALIGIAMYCGLHHLWYVLTSTMLFVTIFAFEIAVFVKRYYSKLETIIQAMLHDDFSLSFGIQSGNKIFNDLVELYDKNRSSSFGRESQAALYQQLLNSLESGILILKKQPSGWEIQIINDYFKRFFGVPNVKYWQQLHFFVPQFYAAVEERKFSEYKSTLDIQVNKEERQTFVIQTSISKVAGQEYYIILLDSIQRVIDVKENKAWLSIMKVIAHELMNSLTPIHSLAGNVHDLLNQASWSDEDREDIQESVNIILNRSDHLQKFVERYRQLTMLPTPQIELTKLYPLLHNCLRSYSHIVEQKNIFLNYSIRPDLEVMVDPIQMEQVFINLFTNSLYALENEEERRIEVKAYVQQRRIYIEFSDSGVLIDENIIAKIFLPFYTTRKEGGGIGLTLSKSIVEGHNGYLFYQNKANVNTFVVALPAPGVSAT